jgi:hypothetical protein
MQASGSGEERRRGKGFPLKIFLISINPAYFWVPPVCSIFSKRYEKKLFSVITMSKESSQLHSMVKQRYSGRRGYIPC